MCCCALLLFIHVSLLLTQTWWTWGTASGPGSGEQLGPAAPPSRCCLSCSAEPGQEQLQLTCPACRHTRVCHVHEVVSRSCSALQVVPFSQHHQPAAHMLGTPSHNSLCKCPLLFFSSSTYAMSFGVIPITWALHAYPAL